MNARTPEPKQVSELVSDAELARAAQRGDKRAFVEIVARHQAMVCGIALGILGDFAASEDAGQETFLTAWRKIHELRDPERLRAWLGQIARNAARGQLRSLRSHEPLDEKVIVLDESPTPDEASANKEEAALVRQSLAHLPENYRLPLILYYREGQSVRAVAESLGISEDAVKQRLARGREMCRDRIAGLIETVLTRTRPTGIFTMGIAVAIGALAAPSAMAGAAFGSAAVASSSPTSAVKAFFTSIMTSSKVFLAASAAVAMACVPIGYSIYHGEPAPAAKPASEAAGAAPASGPNFADSPLVAEWRELHERYGTNAQAMPALYKAITDLKDSFHREALKSTLISEWAGIDAAGGLAFFMSKGHPADEREQYFREFLGRDPQAAVSGLLSAGPGWDTVARDCLKDIAHAAPGRVAEVASQLPKADNYWDANVRDAFAIVAEGGLEAARQAAEGVTGPNRDQALEGIATTWASSDLDAALAWAKALPKETDRNEIIRCALVGEAAVNPKGALDAVGVVPSGGNQSYFASTTGARVLAAAAQADFDGTVAWLVNNPGRLGQEDLIGLADTVTRRLNADPAGFLSAQADEGSLKLLLPAISSALLNGSAGERGAVWNWLVSQPDSPVIKSLRDQVLNSAAWQDPAFAMQLVPELPNTSEGDAQVKRLSQNLLNGGQNLGLFDQFLSAAPERLQTPLVESAFNLLRGEDLSDPQTWAQRLSLLPPTERTHGAVTLAQAWAEQSPADAITWAGSLPQGDTQNAVAAAITSAWAAKDAPGATAWVASLPSGAERDQSATALVGVIASNFSTEAWDWALSIGDQNERYDAAAKVIQAMANKDSANAQRLINSAPFTPDAKVKLQALLQPGPATN